jgi:hypothetical protein
VAIFDTICNHLACGSPELFAWAAKSAIIYLPSSALNMSAKLNRSNASLDSVSGI